MSEELQQVKRGVAGLAGPYGHPLHPALVALPIGVWVAGFVFDLASRAVADGRMLSEASVWLIGLGVLGAVAAAAVGFLDLLVIPTGTRVFRLALLHMAINLTVTVAFAVGFALRLVPGRGLIDADRVVLRRRRGHHPHRGDPLHLDHRVLGAMRVGTRGQPSHRFRDLKIGGGNLSGQREPENATCVNPDSETRD